MWSSFVFLGLFFPLGILGLDQMDLEFSVDYFRHRSDKFICLLTCEKDYWTRSFVNLAAKHDSRVSSCAHAACLDTCLLHKYTSVGVLTNTACDGFEEVMYYASENALLGAKHHWLILHGSGSRTINKSLADKTTITNANNVERVLNIIENLNISVDTDISLAIQGTKNFEIYELFNFGKIQGGDLNVRKSGIWAADTGTISNLNEYKYYRRWNFHQWQMRLVTVVSKPDQFEPKILTDRRATPGVATIIRTSTTILNDIAEIHNFRFIHAVSDRWIGKYSLNESKPLAAATTVYFKQQDITPVLRYIDGIDSRVDFIHPPVTSIETKYYYRIPTYGVGKFENQFLRPLSTGTWLLVLVVLSLCAGVLVISANLERRSSAGQYAVFSVIATLCQQSRKLTILVTGLSCVLIYNYYTSSVVSWLLNGPPPSINSLQELLDSPLDLIFEDIGYTRSWLQTPNYYYNKMNAKVEDEIRRKKVFNKKKNAPLLMPVTEGIKYVEAGGFAYHTEVDTANRLISRAFTKSELCELGSLQSMEKTLLYAALQKDSPYKEFFSWSVMRLTERGIVQCVQLRTTSQAFKREGSCPRALALGGAAPAFLLLAGGFFLATVIMFIERAIWRRKSESKVDFKLKKKKLNYIPEKK